MAGWIKISRKIVDHWLWQDAERLKWWLDLLFIAAWERKRQLVGKQLVFLQQGQLIASLSFLCKRWGRSRTMVEPYLALLVEEGMIRKEVSRNISIITILNYDKYQANNSAYLEADLTNEESSDYVGHDDSADAHLEADPDAYLDSSNQAFNDAYLKADLTNGKPDGYIQPDAHLDAHLDATNKEYKEVNNNITKRENIEIKEKSGRRFLPPSIEDVRLYIQEKSYVVDAEQFVNFYESKNWMVGKNKMSNWHAAVATWQRREREKHGTHNRQKQENRRGSFEVTATTAEDYEGSF